MSRKMTWLIEMSHPVNIPEKFEARNVPDLKQKLQRFADNYDHPIGWGELKFSEEYDRRKRPQVLRAYFYGAFTGEKKRFMRLRRQLDA
jgi:hypothetical protein